jgi:hypothetical protein
MSADVSYKPTYSKPNRQRLRAIIEIDGDKLEIFPIAGSDGDERAIRYALRFVREDCPQ